MTKEKVFKQVLPNGKYSNGRMHNLLSEAYLTIKKFLIFQTLTDSPNLQKLLLIQAFQKHAKEEVFFYTATKEITRLENKTIKEWEEQSNLSHLYRQVYHHPSQTFQGEIGKDMVNKMGKQIDIVYALDKAAVINEKLLRQRILNDEYYELTEELEMWELLSQNIEHPAIDLYRLRFAYRTKTMLEQYYELRAAFLLNYKTLNIEEQKVHLFSLLNDTTHLAMKTMLTAGDSLPLYQLGLQTGVLLQSGVLSFKSYVAIVGASNFNKDFAFTKSFINSFTCKLSPSVQSDALAWAKAHTLYREGVFDNCLEVLIKEKFQTSFFKLLSKILITQTYFDLYLKDSSYQFYLFNYLDAFERWLLRMNKQSTIRKKPYLRFVQLSRILAKQYGSIDFQAEKVKNLLDKEKAVQATTWLRQKQVDIINLRKEKGERRRACP